jgi:hypothetical protein
VMLGILNRWWLRLPWLSKVLVEPSTNYTSMLVEYMQWSIYEAPPGIRYVMKAFLSKWYQQLSRDLMRTHCWLVNPSGRPGKHYPADLLQEHNNAQIKVLTYLIYLLSLCSIMIYLACACTNGTQCDLDSAEQINPTRSILRTCCRPRWESLRPCALDQTHSPRRPIGRSWFNANIFKQPSLQIYQGPNKRRPADSRYLISWPSESIYSKIQTGCRPCSRIAAYI